MDKVREILIIPEELEAFPLGYPDETKEQQDRFDTARIHYVR